jgi:predicted PurR-regulated permease PerM
VNSGVVEVVRNLKSEINLPVLTEEDLLKLKSNLSIPAANRVIVAGSTRKGEEKKLIEAYSRAKSVKENLLLILAPRHPERFDDLSSLGPFFSFISHRFLIFVFLIFILAGRGNIRAKIEKSFSKERFSQIIDVIEKIDT